MSKRKQLDESRPAGRSKPPQEGRDASGRFRAFARRWPTGRAGAAEGGGLACRRSHGRSVKPAYYLRLRSFLGAEGRRFESDRPDQGTTRDYLGIPIGLTRPKSN